MATQTISAPSTWTSYLLPSAKDLGPFESFFDFRDPEGNPVSSPYLGPVMPQKREVTHKSRNDLAPDAQGSTALWLGAALVAAILL